MECLDISGTVLWVVISAEWNIWKRELRGRKISTICFIQWMLPERLDEEGLDAQGVKRG
jgi:hypothetical protein